MKILKKIGIGCLALIICFCSCFKSVDAFQSGFESSSSPIYQSPIGSIGFSINEFGNATSVYNESFNFQTDFYYPNSMNSDFAISSTRDYGFETHFTSNDFGYSVSQEVYFSESGLWTYQFHFSDIFVYLNWGDLPILTIDNGYANYEQMYWLTYSGNIYDTSTSSLLFIEENQPKQFGTQDNRYFSYSLRNLFKDIVASEVVNEDYLGGLGFIKDLTITITYNDSISQNYPTTIKLDELGVQENARNLAYEQFNAFLTDYETPGLFGWLLSSIDAFMSAELFPNFSVGVLLGTIVAIPLLIYILRLFMGG